MDYAYTSKEELFKDALAEGALFATLVVSGIYHFYKICDGVVYQIWYESYDNVIRKKYDWSRCIILKASEIKKSLREKRWFGNKQYVYVDIGYVNYYRVNSFEMIEL